MFGPNALHIAQHQREARPWEANLEELLVMITLGWSSIVTRLFQYVFHRELADGSIKSDFRLIQERPIAVSYGKCSEA